MKLRILSFLVLGAIGVGFLVYLGQTLRTYQVGVMINVLMYAILVTAWNIFSGSTGYISLATSAFFGLGIYGTALFGGQMSLGGLLATVTLVVLGVAAIVGLSTLRLRGIYFVIFTYGLTELIRELTLWWEINISHTVGRWIDLRLTTHQIYYALIAVATLLAVVVMIIHHTRLGYALRTIGSDEEVAEHLGINTRFYKIGAFAISAWFMAITGVLVAPRWSYIDPRIAFDPLISFMTLIMALFGGVSRSWGPVLGAIPLVFLSEVLSTRFPEYFLLILGALLIALVLLMPGGLVQLLDSVRQISAKRLIPSGSEGRESRLRA